MCCKQWKRIHLGNTTNLMTSLVYRFLYKTFVYIISSCMLIRVLVHYFDHLYILLKVCKSKQVALNLLYRNK